ncbi:hypothetical protein NDU88_007141 [Pleurodeles waltl]|uniref:Uncharacterized protein n=1 Tax=Pleurodeles waltl TaxID=8319 RepID=A0AAV7URI9_PLEWA|nr:hypothetical protein NDU88_007141 [Pleurodeles waltl]
MALILTLAVGGEAAVGPRTDRRSKKWHSDRGGHRRVRPPLSHSDRHGGHDRRAGVCALRPGGRPKTANRIMTLLTAAVFGGREPPCEPWR